MLCQALQCEWYSVCRMDAANPASRGLTHDYIAGEERSTTL